MGDRRASEIEDDADGSAPSRSKPAIAPRFGRMPSGSATRQGTREPQRQPAPSSNGPNRTPPQSVRTAAETARSGAAVLRAASPRWHWQHLRAQAPRRSAYPTRISEQVKSASANSSPTVVDRPPTALPPPHDKMRQIRAGPQRRLGFWRALVAGASPSVQATNAAR